MSQNKYWQNNSARYNTQIRKQIEAGGGNSTSPMRRRVTEQLSARKPIEVAASKWIGNRRNSSLLLGQPRFVVVVDG